MRVTETEMSNGDTWSLELVDSTPYGSVRDRLTESVRQLDGYICVFDTSTDYPTTDAALWTGRIMQRRGAYGYAGTNLASLIQTSDDLGRHAYGSVPRTAAATTYQTWTLATWINEVLGTNYNGITKGTITTTGLSSFASWWILGLGGIEIIQAACAMAGGAVWRIDPSGELTAGPRATIFPTATSPEVIVTQDVSVGDQSLRGVRGGVTALVEDSSQITSQVIAVGAGSGLNLRLDVSATQNVARGFDGAYATIRRLVDANQTDDATALATIADTALAGFSEVTKTYEVTAFDPIRAHVKPGDTIYVYDPVLDVNNVDAVGIIPSGVADIEYNGQSIRPVGTIVRSMSWETHSDQGVWLYRPGEAAVDQWTDLTRYVVHSEAPETRMVVGDLDVPTVTIAGPEAYEVRRSGPLFPPGADVEIGNDGPSDTIPDDADRFGPPR